jgi:hypothetical protein
LLRAAINGFRAAGLSFAEAYPRRGADSASAKYHGSVGMYLASGFAVVDERDDGTSVVRLTLKADGAAHADV